MTFPWLTFLGLVPLVGAVVMCLPIKQIARGVAMVFALLTVGVGIGVTVLYVGGTSLAEKAPGSPPSVPGGRSGSTAWPS